MNVIDFEHLQQDATMIYSVTVLLNDPFCVSLINQFQLSLF